MIQKFNKKIMHMCIIIVIISAIIFTALMIILRYNVNGETNMPFDISKIAIISTVDAQDVEDDTNRWNLNVSQNNDIYIYINKNSDYKKTETIKTVTINNINIVEEPAQGKITTYKPSSTNNISIFENTEEYESNEILFTGEQSTNIQNLQISNQGGNIAFRCSNNNLAQFVSNEGETVNYDQLLKRLEINNDDLKAKISFDLTIVLNSGRVFQATFNVDIPVDDIVEEGQTSTEITDFSDVVFKRIEN